MLTLALLHALVGHRRLSSPLPQLPCLPLRPHSALPAMAVLAYTHLLALKILRLLHLDIQADRDPAHAIGAASATAA